CFQRKSLVLRFLLGLAPRKGCRALRHRKTGRLLNRPFQPYPKYEYSRRNAFCCPVSLDGSLRQWSPLATALPCGVRTFLTSKYFEARPSVLSVGKYNRPLLHMDVLAVGFQKDNTLLYERERD